MATIHLGGVGGGDIWEFRVSIFVLKNFIVKIKLEEFFWQRSIWAVSVEGTSVDPSTHLSPALSQIPKHTIDPSSFL